MAIILPSGKTSFSTIPNYCFAQCTSLTTINYNSREKPSVLLGSNIINIGDYAFYECSGLSNVVIHSSFSGLNSGIGTSAF